MPLFVKERVSRQTRAIESSLKHHTDLLNLHSQSFTHIQLMHHMVIPAIGINPKREIFSSGHHYSPIALRHVVRYREIALCLHFQCSVSRVLGAELALRQVRSKNVVQFPCVAL